MKIIRIIVATTLVCLFFFSCQKPDQTKVSIRTGQIDCFRKLDQEKLVKYDSLNAYEHDMFSTLGKIQLPINRILKSDNYFIYINIVIPSNIELLHNAHERQSQFEVLSKNNNQYFLKYDSLYCTRIIIPSKNQPNEYLYTVEFVSSDSSKVNGVFLQKDWIEKRVSCIDFK